MKKTKIKEPLLPSLEEFPVTLKDETLIEQNLLQQQDYSYSHYTNLVIRESHLKQVFWGHSRLERFECSNVIFEKCDLSNLEWIGASFHQVVFKQCKLVGTNFAESFLRDVRFEDCLGNLASFSMTNLKAVAFQDCQLPESEFYELKWQNLNLTGCELTGSNWFRTKLAGLDFTRNSFEQIAFSQELLKGLKVNQEQALIIAAGLGIQIED